VTQNEEEEHGIQRIYPPLPWGVAAAYVIGLASLAMPAWKVGWGRYDGWECAGRSAEFLVWVLRGDNDELFKSTFTISNLLMLCAPGLPLIRPDRRRIWPAVAATLASLHVLSWFLAKHEPEERIRFGYWFWLASFVTLAGALWLWEARVRSAGETAGGNG
jgi:hypothetical protein